MWDQLTDLFANISALEAWAVVFASAYLLLVIRQSIWCWPAAFISVLLSFVLFAGARLYMQSLLQLFYGGMAVYGWYQWRHGGVEHHGVSISTWSLGAHIGAIGSIAIFGVAIGFGLSRTQAALPYLDSLTTVAALVTTFMVARKVLENWIYWFVIDAASAYLYAARGLPLYAALFVLYLVLVVIGFIQWWREWRAPTASTA